jgi:predicted nucleic acid-binding protein
MLYLDTCLLIPLFAPEATSDKVRAFFTENAVRPMAISTWTQTEFFSAISLKVRTAQISRDQAHIALRAFQEIAEESLTIFLPSGTAYKHSLELLTHFDSGLRAGDALHLAIARERHATIVTLDQLMLGAAQAAGIPSLTL